MYMYNSIKSFPSLTRLRLVLVIALPCPCRRVSVRRENNAHRTAGVAGFGYDVATSSAPNSAVDRAFDGGDSVDPEDTWWVAAAAGAGVGLGVVLIGAVLFTKLGKKAGRPAVQSSYKRGDSLADETKAEPF